MKTERRQEDMSTGGSSREWPKGLSAGGSGAVFGPCDWSKSYFEIQKMRLEEEELGAKCVERKQILESLNQRKDELRSEMSQMKEVHLSHHMFLQSKDVDRMVQKAELKQAEVLLVEADRQRLGEEYEHLQKRKGELETQVLNHSHYQDFLQQVLKLSKFTEVKELVDHLESLVHFRDQLCERDSEDQERVNQLRTDLVTLEDQSHLRMVHGRNQLSHLQGQMERTRSEAFLWEQKWNHIEETAAKKTLLLGKIKMATLNLYEMTCSSLDNSQQSVDVNDTEAQLKKIQEFIQDHKDIIEKYSKEQADEKAKWDVAS